MITVEKKSNLREKSRLEVEHLLYKFAVWDYCYLQDIWVILISKYSNFNKEI